MLSKSHPPNAHHFRWADWVYPCLHAILVVIAFSAHADTDCTAVTEIPTAQCETLIDLYNSTDGDNWTANDNWLQNNTPCNWRGIVCSGGGVTEIDLNGKGLNGPLPDISALTTLTLVKLYSNALTGPIPDLSALTQLSYLHLYGNDFSGTIPELKTLTQLKNLYLGRNDLTGPIPDFTGLTNLQYIQLQENELSGDIPDFRDNTNLRELRLEYNQLTGTIPDLTHLTNMQRLGLYANQFTGEIPDLTGLTNMWYLALSSNQLSGTIPAYISQLTNLKELYLNNNQLTGTIFDLSALTNLQTLKLNDNQLTGTIPDEISTLTNLRNLGLNSNQLTGTIPDLSQLTGLSYLALSYNQFTGSMPSFTTLTNLKEVYLQGNQFTGNVPDLSSLGLVQKLGLHGNKLTGEIPDLSALEKAWYIALSGNQLTGSIPDLSKLTRVSELYLHTNQLSGPIPDLSQLANVRYLQFHNNKLSGSIPDLSQLTNLKQLYLQGNELSGTIPDLSALTRLDKLALNTNKLTGEIPESINQLSNAWYIALSYNQLSGQIPDLTGLTKLSELYLHDNFLTGSIPDVSVLPNAKNLFFANNLLTGSLPDLSALTKLQSLRIQNNNLSGAIPDMSTLVNLKQLYLDGNPQLCKDADINYTGRSEVDNIALCPGADVNLVATTNATACVGQNMAITITKQLPQTVDGIQIGLTFEPATLKVNSMTGSGVLDTLKNEFDNQAGTVQFAAGNFFRDPVANDFELVTINVTPLAASSGTPVSFNAAQTVATYNRNDLESDTENLTLAIEYCPESPVTFSCDNVEGITSAQCEVLVALYDNTDGNNWTNNAGWKRTNTPCSWQGVTCDNDEVTAIDLTDNHLNGDVPDLGALPSLQTLELTSNQLCKTPNTDYSQWSALDDVLSCDDPSYGLLGYWTFDNCDATDSSDNHFDGVFRGEPTCVDGVQGKGLYFDGDDAIDVDGGRQLAGYNITLSAWAYITQDTRGYIAIKYDRVGKNGINYSLAFSDSGNFKVGARTENAIDDQDLGIVYYIQPEELGWVHVAEVLTPESMKLYFNGELKNSMDLPEGFVAYTGTQKLGIGGAPMDMGPSTTAYQNTFLNDAIIDELSVYNYAFSEAQIENLYNATKPTTTGCNGDIQLADNLCEGLTAYYPMDGNANDASGNGNNGTVNGATLTTDRHGSANSAYEFDGQSHYISIADSPQVDFAQSQDFAVAFWVKVADIQPFTASGDNDIIEKWDGEANSQSYPYVFRYLNQKSKDHGKIVVGRYDGDNNPSFGSTVKINDDQFHHIVFVKNGEQLQLFIDGDLDNTLTDRTVGNTANNSPLFLGRRGSPLKNQFKGVIDDLLIHNRALTEAEVQTLYDSNKPATTGCNGDLQLADNLCEGLTAYYPMDGNANDASGNGNNGTVNGATLTTDRHGNADNAYYFNGNGHATDSIQIPHTVINGLTDVTTSVWIQTDDLEQGILSGANNAQQNHYLLYMIHGKIQTHIKQDDSFVTSSIINDGQWHQIVFVREGSSGVAQVFIDGNSVGSKTLPAGALSISPNGLWIGRDQDCVGGCFEDYQDFLGSIDDLIIYNRALTASEIQAHYDSTKPATVCDGVTEIPTAQCEALVALYNNTDGDNWTNNEGWKTTDTPCSWYGVECTDGNITKMSLEDNQLSGTIPELSNLTGLMDLRLYSNQLTGTIPELSALTQLQTLFLNNNQLSGPIPELTALTELQRIYLALNKLSGPMPELTALTKLEDLDFSHNQLTGSIPDLSQLAELQRFRVLNNQFSGEIPALGSLAKLDTIDLSGNSELCQNSSADYADKTEVDAFANCASFCDEVTEIPTTQCETLVALYDSTNGDDWKNNSGWKQTNTPCSWFGVTCNGNSVIKLALGGNRLIGTIPELKALVDIEELYLRENKLISGTIPELKSLTKLRKLYLNDNQLSGPIPELKDLVNLQELKLGGNKLTGPIPDLSTLTNLQLLGLAYNQLTGNIPKAISELTQLQAIGLARNQLTGEIPDLSQLTHLEWLDLSQNSLTGSIPDWSSLTQLKTVYLYTNQLTGSIPSLNNLVNLKELKLGENQLTGPIPDVSTLTNLTVLALGYNQLSGPIPALNTLTKLQGLFLRENNLSGPIPELKSLTNLRNLYLDGNNLSGSIPEWNTLTKLEIIYLTNNQLTGSIPDLTNLTKLIELRAAKNQLTGNIPDLSSLTQLTGLHLGLNQLTGPIPDLSHLPHLRGVGLHDNQLTGSIPSLSHQTSLTTLWLLNNNLTGPIPDLSNLRNVRELRLQNNELSGPIPALDNLTNLTFLGLGGNTDLCRGTNIDYGTRTEVNPFTICEGAEVKIIAQASASACIGQNLTVTVQKQLTQNVDAIQLALTFDPNTLKVNSVTGNTVLNRELDNRFNNSEGTVEFAAVNVVGDGISEEFTVATINFTPLASSVETALQFHSTQTFATLKGATLRQDLQGTTLAIKDCVSEVIIQPDDYSEIWTLVEETDAIEQTGANLDAPKSLSFDASGNAYIADTLNHRILKRDTQGNLSVVAGNGKKGSTGDGGPAIEAKLNNPQGTAIDHEGNLYIADTNNHRIRKVDSNGIITTVVGIGKAGNTGDNGLANQAKLRKPTAIVFDNNGHLYIADSGNHRIRKVSGQRTRKPSANSIITTVAGNGRSGYQGDNGPANQAKLSNPSGLAVDSQNHLYIADTDNHRIRKVDNQGIITTVAGNGNKGYSGDGDPATAAQLNAPIGLEVDSAGSLFIADRNNHRIRKVDTDGIITTFTGNGKSGTSTDGILAGVAQISQPSDVALDQYGNLYIADKGNDTIRKIGEKDGETDKAEAPPHQVVDCSNTTVTRIPENECYALVAFYDSTKGPEWTNNDGWKATDTPCQWEGVSCQDGHVTVIDLPNNNLVGDVPPQIGALVNLKTLNLNDNQISGAIPTTIEHLNNLETLNLANNVLTGSLPMELGDATNLKTVNLANNQISGVIPDLNALTQLQTLNLSENMLNGPVPDLTDLPALQTLDISGEEQQLCQEGETDVGNSPVGNLDDCPTDNQLPIAAFTATPNKGEASLMVQLDARSSYDPYGNITAYFWETSDGQVLIGSTPRITYTKSGIYEIRLRVMDHDGAPSINVATHLIEVNPGPDQVTLNLDKDGTGLGTVYIRRDRDKNQAITCNMKCQAESQDYPLGSEIKLTAKAVEGSLFTGWRGDCVGTEAERKITVTMDSAKQCTAVFELEATPPSTMHALTIDSVSTLGSGGIIEVRDIVCHEPPCMSYQQADKQVKITGTPIPHSYFIMWNLECPVLGEYTDATNLVVLTKETTCIAYFGNDSDPAAVDTAKEFEQEGELHTGESVTEIYPPADNRERYEQAFRVAEKAMMTVEDQKLLDKESWPDHFNCVENWFDPLPDNLYVESVQIKSGQETIDETFQVAGQYVRVDVRLLNKDGEEELAPILVYYDEGKEPTVEELAPPPLAEDSNLRRSPRRWYRRVRRIIRYRRSRSWRW